MDSLDEDSRVVVVAFGIVKCYLTGYYTLFP